MSILQAPWSWSPQLHRSRPGASHKRRRLPCQDASLTASLRSADGLAIGLMSVADGHGGNRYWLSDVGSRLACELAIRIAANDLAQQRLANSGPAQLEEMRRWLADEWPKQLLASWREAIQSDWEKRTLPPEHQGEVFSAQTYGSTLALVVLTPQWWGHTGLGDWDLVLLSNDQPDQIISQETGDTFHGEATESLCLTRASDCFKARTAIYPLTGDRRQTYGLVLSTDGVRKSCSADADHLALARYLLEEAQPLQAPASGETSRLDPSLDRISSEGSGDDVSVAIACFGNMHPGVAAKPAPEQPELPPPPPELRRPSAIARLPSGIASKTKRQPVSSPSRLLRQPMVTISLLLALGCGLAALAWFRLLPPWNRTPGAVAALEPETQALSAAERQAVLKQIKQLCTEPELIEPSLKARKSQFSKLQNNPAERIRVLKDKDWLGVLIVLNQPEDLLTRNHRNKRDLQACPQLEKALREHWQPSTPPTRTVSNDDGA